jgi:hypothetical protein
MREKMSESSSGTRGCELRNLQWLVPAGRPCGFSQYFARVRDRGAFRSSRADRGAQVLPPAGATVPPWLPAKSAREGRFAPSPAKRRTL